MPSVTFTELESKMAWLMADAGMDAAFEKWSQPERQAALNVFEKLYDAYRSIPRAAA